MLGGFALGLMVLLMVMGAKFLVKAKKEKTAATSSSFFSTLKPTQAPSTPTPTLTPEQIAAIKKKQFDDWNKKYGPCKYIPILMYHHVLDSAAAKAIGAGYLNVPPDIFRQQMEYLINKGYQIIRLDEMISGLRNGSLPTKPAVLTFDDGYGDLYDNLFPVLKEKNIKATVFVISQFVGGGNYLNWGQVKEMSDSGLVLIGDHTLNHLSLLKLSKEEIVNQIVSARLLIENHIGGRVEYFAYPYGGINTLAEQVLKEAGFAGAVVTTNNHPQCLGLPYGFSRIRVGASPLAKYGL